MNLIRLALLWHESGERPQAIARYTEDQILYHSALAIEAQLLVGHVSLNGQGCIHGAIVRRLTWAGHDFLDVARDDQKWTNAVQRIAKEGGAWTFDLLKQILSELAKASLLPQH